MSNNECNSSIPTGKHQSIITFSVSKSQHIAVQTNSRLHDISTTILIGQQNRCVVNERFISPFRGTYNDNDLKHVTLYAYLKAFRFTGSPILYLECEIHMCQSSCPVS